VRSFALVAVALAAVGARPLLAHGPAASARTCSATPVRYAAPPAAPDLPFVSVGKIDGYLFYYPPALADPRVHGSEGLVIYAGGESPDGQVAMKILWRTRHPAATLRIVGRRLDARGAFVQRLPADTSRVEFPSIVDVPAAGCWRLTLTAGAAHARLVVRAVAPVQTAGCAPTRLDLIGNVRLRPTSEGLTAGWSWSTDDGGALLYAGGRHGDQNMKVLWTAERRYGGSLDLLGTRLDAAGSFEQQFPMAQSPVGDFPSTVDVPTAGCWLLRARTGRLGGTLVVRVVAP
jgi:hypothetical protein